MLKIKNTYFSQQKLFLSDKLLLIIMLFIIILTCIDTMNKRFNVDLCISQQEFEETLGYLSYTQLQSMNANSFGEYMNSSEDSYHTFEGAISIEKQGKFYYYQKRDALEFENIMNEYIQDGTISEYNRYSFAEIASLSLEEYEKIKYSLYAGGKIPLNTLRRVSGSMYDLHYPTYQQAKLIWESENTSSYIARQYYFEISQTILLLVGVATIWFMLKDKFFKVNNLILMTGIKTSYIYIKMLIPMAVISVVTFFSSIVWAGFKMINVVGTYNILDFISYYFIVLFIPSLFVGALAIILSLIIKDIGITAALLSTYVFFTTAKSTTMENGINHWNVSLLRPIPRINQMFIEFDEYKSSFFTHNIFYLFLFGVTLLLIYKIWKDKIMGRSNI